MVPGLAKYEIYEPVGVDSVCHYFLNKPFDRLRIDCLGGAHYAIYTVEIAEEEVLFIMLSIPDIIIKKCDSKVNT